MFIGVRGIGEGEGWDGGEGGRDGRGGVEWEEEKGGGEGGEVKWGVTECLLSYWDMPPGFMRGNFSKKDLFSILTPRTFNFFSK